MVSGGCTPVDCIKAVYLTLSVGSWINVPSGQTLCSTPHRGDVADSARKPAESSPVISP